MYGYNDQGEWHRIGGVPVDSGTIMVVDPCYVLRDKRDEDDPNQGDPENGLEYLHAQRLDLPEDHPDYGGAGSKQLSVNDFRLLGIPADAEYPNLGSPRGFIMPSGFGDGEYPIFIRTKDFGDWGTRVTGIFIDLGDRDQELDEEDVEDETPSAY